jgi:hypothetical protein
MVNKFERGRGPYHETHLKKVFLFKGLDCNGSEARDLPIREISRGV